MTYDFDALLDRVEKPARYTGGEMNAEVKPISQAEISFAFCFPRYLRGGHEPPGHEILYGILNELPYAVCERVCMPWWTCFVNFAKTISRCARWKAIRRFPALTSSALPSSTR